ncbi:thiosulfate oxidation carrier protein SoxY [Thermithiobacillus plumbiphilus]|uniref:Thiosulfate oxidation carrier protein SoxY n=1 Tax=Thermithiobacillus plumbiphilus TaxID=1729899 RepID=A0ABU9DA64_9PROT
MENSINFKRRNFLRSSLATGALVAAAGTGLLKVPAAMAAEWPANAFKADKLDKAMQDVLGTTQVPEGKVDIKAPTIAENGAVVPITVSTDSPMTADDYVSDIFIFAEGNPAPLVASFHLTPMSGKAEVSTRIKMGKTSNVRAVVKTNKGELMQAAKEVKVTIGGCGG